MIHYCRQLQIIIETAHLILTKICLLPALRFIVIIGNRCHHRRSDRIVYLYHTCINASNICNFIECTAAEYKIRYLCIIDAVIYQQTDTVSFLSFDSCQTDDAGVICRCRLKLHMADSLRLKFTVCQRNGISLCRIGLRSQSRLTYGLYSCHHSSAETVFHKLALLNLLDSDLQDIICGIAAQNKAVALSLIFLARHPICDHRTIYIIGIGRCTCHKYTDGACGTDRRLHHLSPAVLFRIQIDDILALKVGAVQLVLRDQVLNTEILSCLLRFKLNLHMVVILGKQRTYHIILICSQREVMAITDAVKVYTSVL